MGEVVNDQTVERGHEPMRDLGRKVEPELLDRDQATRVGLVGAKDRSKNADADLVKDTEGTEGVRRRGAGSVRVQRGYSSREGSGS
jgi:hypothetical protein